MPLLKPGDVGTVHFPGAHKPKRRPVLVISTALYHDYRPDAVVAALTTNLEAAHTPFDYHLKDWEKAGLRRPSAVRAYFETVLQSELDSIGHLSLRDWEAAQASLAKALALT